MFKNGTFNSQHKTTIPPNGADNTAAPIKYTQYNTNYKDISDAYKALDAYKTRGTFNPDQTQISNGN